MSVIVKIPAPLRTVTAGQAQVECAPGTVRDLITQVDGRYGGFAERVMDDGQLRRFVNVFVSGEDVRFADGIETAVAAGARAVVQPGGSNRDEEVIAAANRLGVPMLMTGRRHFRH